MLRYLIGPSKPHQININENLGQLLTCSIGFEVTDAAVVVVTGLASWLKVNLVSVPGELRCEDGIDDSTPLSC